MSTHNLCFEQKYEKYHLFFNNGDHIDTCNRYEKHNYANRYFSVVVNVPKFRQFYSILL